MAFVNKEPDEGPRLTTLVMKQDTLPNPDPKSLVVKQDMLLTRP